MRKKNVTPNDASDLSNYDSNDVEAAFPVD